MREILGRRRRLLSWRIGRKSEQSPPLIGAALTFATAWRWPVLPGVGTDGPSRQSLGTPAVFGGRADTDGLDGTDRLDGRPAGTRGSKDAGEKGKRGGKRRSRAARRRAANRPASTVVTWYFPGSAADGDAVGPADRDRSGATDPGAVAPGSGTPGAPGATGVSGDDGFAGARPEGPGLGGGPARCACPDPECVVPGAHPLDPGLLAATTDERMVRWWWTNRPGAPILLATGGRAPCAVSLPAAAGARALAALDLAGVRLGPVVATSARYFVLVAPYSMERLGELLYAKDRVPGSLRFHGEGGYIPLPPSETGQGQARWERAPLPGPALRRPGKGGSAATAPAPGSAAPWVPDVETVVDAVVDALTHTGVSAPEF